MARKYWFKANRYGYGWSPETWEGWLVFTLYLAGLVYSFLQVSAQSLSATDTFFNFLPRFFIFSALLLIISYLKGEPTYWKWGEKKEETKG